MRVYELELEAVPPRCVSFTFGDSLLGADRRDRARQRLSSVGYNREAIAVHVALLLRDLPVGGVERVTLRLAEGLVGAGCRVSLAVFEATGGFVDAVPDGVRLVALGGPADLWTAPWRAPRLVRRLADWLDTVRPDVVVASKEQAHAVLLAARRRASWDGPAILARHVPPGRLARALYRTMHGDADAIVAVSAELADALRSIVQDPSRVHHLPNAVLEPGWKARAAQRPNHPWLSRRPLLVCAGRLDRQKGQDLLIEALPRVPEVHLLLVGDGPARRQLQRAIAARGLTDRVALVGAVPDALPWIAAADLCVVPSRYEGLPSVIVEALACGVPVVAADCPTGPRELLPPDDLVPPGDPVALAAGLRRALADRRPIAFDPTPFTTPGATRRWLALLEDLRAQRRRAPG